MQALLEQQRDHGEVDHKGRFELVNRTRQALAEEADELCEHASEDMDFRTPTASSPPQHGRRDRAETAGEDAGIAHRSDDDALLIVRHRFDKPPTDGSERTTRRVVTLRDRRIGRPQTKTRHGTDPPA